jgi:hypothetical protein
VIGSRAYAVFGTSGTNYNDLWEYGNLNDVNSIEKETVAVKTFPNPFNERLTLLIPQEILLDESSGLTIMNISGQIIKTIDNIRSHEIIIERESMAKGMYFYELIINKNTKSTGKFITE